MAWEWTPATEEAAFYVAEDNLTNERIAKKAGVDRRTLTRWKQQPEFAARVVELRDALRQDVLQTGFADKLRRIRGLDDKARQIESVIDARAADARARLEAVAKGGALPPGDVPPEEATTGLLVCEHKTVGSGETQQIITQWSVDTATLKAYREVLQQIAMETGEWGAAPPTEQKQGRAPLFTQPATVQVVSRN